MTTQRTDELTSVATLVAELDICMFTTRAEDGGIAGRPMSNNGQVEWDGDSWFFSFDDTAKVRQIEAEPRVQLGFIDSANQVWVNVEGEATVVRDDVERKQALWQPELERWFEDGPDDPEVVLIKVSARHIDAWSPDGERSFDMPA